MGYHKRREALFNKLNLLEEEYIDKVLEDKPKSPLESEAAARERIRRKLRDDVLPEKQFSSIDLGLDLFEEHILSKCSEKEQIEWAKQVRVLSCQLVSRVLEPKEKGATFPYPDEQIVEFYLLGQEFYQKKIFTEAKAIFTLLSILRPEEVGVWISLGLVSLDRNEAEEALLYFSNACIFDPHHLQALSLTAELLIELKHLEHAEKFLEQIKTVAEQSEEPQLWSQVFSHLNILYQEAKLRR
ncbi:MAG: hypothetical protein CMO81_06320 [Waddliaceae bacterium]|nr:hypothetical protein [Waddliaceae bacterium]